MSEKIKFKRDINVIFREEGDAGLLFNPQTGRINILNETGKYIWSCLESEKDRSVIVDGLAAQFDISDISKAEEDVDSFISSLGNAGLLEGYTPAPKFPRSVCFGITSRCNFSCKHCINRNVPDSGPDMTTGRIINVIDQMAAAGVKNVSLFGGEPLCHPEFRRIVGYISKRSISMSLNTNGSLIDSEYAKWLKLNNITGAVVSFDGSGSGVMDGMRGEGAFERSMKGVAALRGVDIPVLLSVTLTKLNYKNIRDMVLLGRKIGGGSIRFNHVFFGGNAACFIKELYLNSSEEEEAIEAVWNASKEFKGFVSNESSYLCQKDKLLKAKSHKASFDKISVPPCGAGRAKCAIRPDGWLVPCEILWEVKAGNLKDDKLIDIWQNSKVLNSFRHPLELDLEELPECKGCSYQYLCFLGHRCYPYYNPGGVKNRALYCRRLLS